MAQGKPNATIALQSNSNRNDYRSHLNGPQLTNMSRYITKRQVCATISS